MKIFQTIPKWVIVLAMFMLCICCMQFLKKCLKIENFSDQDNATVTVTNYWANWCGHSTNFKPEWDSFKADLNASEKLAFAQDFDCGVDATVGTDAEKADKAAAIAKCQASKVPGYPSVVITYTDKGGAEKKIDYNGPRTKAGLDAKVAEILKELE